MHEILEVCTICKQNSRSKILTDMPVYRRKEVTLYPLHWSVKQHAIDTCNEINNNFWLLSNSQPIVRYLIASKNFYGWFVQIRILASFTQCIDFYNSLLLFSHPLVSDCLGPHGLQHVRPLCPSPSPRVCQVHIHCIGDAIQLLHRWCHPAISSSDTPFFFCPQSFPTSGT